jgi:hypothetical protein
MHGVWMEANDLRLAFFSLFVKTLEEGSFFSSRSGLHRPEKIN